MKTEGRSYARGRRPRSRQEGTLAGAAIAIWIWLVGVVWLVCWTLGIW